MKQYTVTGMSCAACSARVEKAVSEVPGVTSCSVSLLTNSMGVEGTAAPQEIIRAVENAGYGAAEKKRGGAETAGAAEFFSGNTARSKAGTVSSLPTMQRSAGQASAAGRVDKRPSVRSAFAIWWKTLVPIFHLCFACEVW